MTIKKLTFCILCSANAANLATEEDFNDEISSNSKVEENILINKNNWNRGEIEKGWVKIINFIASGVIEYKYMFHKYCGINVRLNLNNSEVVKEKRFSYFSLEPSLEWIYGRIGKHIFSGSFSPLGFAIVQKNDGSRVNDFCKKYLTLGFGLLKYEYDRKFYLNFGKVKTNWYTSLTHIGDGEFWMCILFNLASIEFGLNIIGVNDWRKKRKENLV